MSALRRLLPPLLLLTLALLLLPQAQSLGHLPRQLLPYLPYVLLAVAALLAQLYNRSRFLAAAGVLALAYWAIRHFLQAPLEMPLPQTAFALLSLWMPLNLLVLLLYPERGLWNAYGLSLLGLLLTLLCALLFWATFYPQQLAQLLALMPVRPLEGVVLSLLAALCYGLVLCVGFVVLSLRDSHAEASLLGCLLMSLVTLLLFDRPQISSVLFAGAALALIWGLLRSSHDMAYRDELTGLKGRRALNETLRGLGGRYVIAMTDVDHFKKFNDSHGHDVGDDVLKMVAAQLAMVTGGGQVFRYGGEEFCIVFKRRDLAECAPHLDAVRERIANYQLTLRDRKRRPRDAQQGSAARGARNGGKTVSVTISIGAAERNALHAKPEAVIKQADKALYEAKGAGRNCLVY